MKKDKRSINFGEKVASLSEQKKFKIKEGKNVLKMLDESKIEFRSSSLNTRKFKQNKIEDITVEKVDIYQGQNNGFTKYGDIYSFGPDGLEFDEPALLTIPYKCNDDFPAALINIYGYAKVKDAWIPAKKVSQDFKNKTITVAIKHFSEWAPGVGSYKVEESGSMSGISSTNSVDNYTGTLSLGFNMGGIGTVGTPIGITARFNSDYLYSSIIDRVTDNTHTIVEPGTTTLPMLNKDLYQFAQGWTFNLPAILGNWVDLMWTPTESDARVEEQEEYKDNNIIKYTGGGESEKIPRFEILMPSGTKYDLSSTLGTPGINTDKSMESSEYSYGEIIESDYTFNTTTQELEPLFHICTENTPVKFWANNYKICVVYTNRANGDVWNFYRIVEVFIPDNKSTIKFRVDYTGTSSNGGGFSEAKVTKIYWLKLGDGLTIVFDDAIDNFNKNKKNKVKKVVSPNGFTINYDWDEFGRIKRITNEKYGNDINDGDQLNTFTNYIKYDERSLNFYYIDKHIYTVMSTAENYGTWNVGDIFLNRFDFDKVLGTKEYISKDATNPFNGKLKAVNILETRMLSTPSTTNVLDIFNSYDYSSLYEIKKRKFYNYSITKEVSGDYVEIINDAGARTKYIFEKGCYSSHRYYKKKRSSYTNSNDVKVYEYDSVGYYAYLNKPKVERVESMEEYNSQIKNVVEYNYNYNIARQKYFYKSDFQGPITSQTIPYSVVPTYLQIITKQEGDVSKRFTRQTIYFDHTTGDVKKGQGTIINEKFVDDIPVFINKTENERGIAIKNNQGNAASFVYQIIKTKFFNKDQSSELYYDSFEYDSFGRLILTYNSKSESYTYTQYSYPEDSYVAYLVPGTWEEAYVQNDKWGLFVENPYDSLDNRDKDAIITVGENNYQTLIPVSGNAKFAIDGHFMNLVSATAIELQGAYRNNFGNDEDDETSYRGNFKYNITYYGYDQYKNLIETTIIDKTGLQDHELFGEFGEVYNYNIEELSRKIISSYSYNTTENHTLTSVTKPDGTVFNIEYFDPTIDGKWKGGLIKKEAFTLQNNIDNNDQTFVTEFDYDIRGRLTYKTNYMDGSTPGVEYDSTKFPKQVAQYEYDDLNRILRKEIGDGTILTTVLVNHYDDDERIIQSIDLKGSKTKIYYDTLFRPFKNELFKPSADFTDDIKNGIIDMDNLSYEGIVDLISNINNYCLINKSESKFHPHFGSIEEAILYTDPTNDNFKIVSHKNFDEIGRTISSSVKVTDSNGTTEKPISIINYDDENNEIMTKTYVTGDNIEENLGKKLSGENWSLSKVKNDWLGRGPIRTYSWPVLNPDTDTDEPLVTLIDYDTIGNTIKTTLPSGETYKYYYNSLGRLEKSVYPDNEIEIINYDINGREIASMNRRGVKTHFEYNKMGLLTKRTIKGYPDLIFETDYSHLGPTKIIEKEGENILLTTTTNYHFSGSPSTVSQTIDDMTKSSTIFYNSKGVPRGSMIQGSGPDAWKKVLAIDEFIYTGVGDNEISSAIYDVSDVFTGTESGDDFNTLISTTTNGIIVQNIIGFDGMLKSTNYGSGQSTEFEYDTFQRLAKINHPDDKSKLKFTRNWIGNIITKEQNLTDSENGIYDTTNEYEYDGMQRMSKDNNEELTFDKLSNIKTRINGDLQKAYDYEPIGNYTNQMRLKSYTETLISDGSEKKKFEYKYDAQGNIIQISNKFKNMIYDGLNRLREIEYYPNDYNTVQKDRYWYDSAGMRFKKEEYIGLGEVTTKTYYLYSGQNILFEEVYIGDGTNDEIKEAKFNVISGGRVLAQFVNDYRN